MTESDPKTRRLDDARVSTYGQTLDAQLEQLRKVGCGTIYREKASGARAERRELLKMLKTLAPGDDVAVTRIDRLARSTFDLFAIVKRIRRERPQWADCRLLRPISAMHQPGFGGVIRLETGPNASLAD
jgi:predicted site-specific integrase-resolvase